MKWNPTTLPLKPGLDLVTFKELSLSSMNHDTVLSFERSGLLTWGNKSGVSAAAIAALFVICVSFCHRRRR